MSTDAMMTRFAPRLIAWQQAHGRHALPWQAAAAKVGEGEPDPERDPYPIWVSEIMLQQTQVDTVIPYYQRFLARFPDIASLADASEDQVLGLWSGLGYYSRARHLHAAARVVLARHGGRFPREPEAILALPGIGRSTAAAIGAFAFGQRAAILDGNVKRVLARVFGVEGWPGEARVSARLWSLAEALLPRQDIRAYTQGLMDLGATLCTRARPRCPACPFAQDCVAQGQGRQASLPAARPRKTVPERRVQVLVLRHAGQVLLEKRPAVGVWGGLWSLPECPAGEDPDQAVRRLGLVPTRLSALAPLRHAFTHFRLHMEPWHIEVTSGARVEFPGRLWVSPADLEGCGLPAPVRKLLRALAPG